MTDIRKTLDPLTLESDIVVDTPFGTLDEAQELLTSVINSLFTWRRANPDDVVDGSTRYGWWGDTYAEQVGDRVGSRLWLLQREKLTDETLARAQVYAEEALQWMSEDQVADSVQVEVRRLGIESALITVSVIRGGELKTFEIPWREVIDG